MLQQHTSWGLKGLQTDFSQGRKAIDTQLVLKHIPKAQWLESKLQLSLWICEVCWTMMHSFREKLLRHESIKQAQQVQIHRVSIITVSIKQICKVTTRSVGYSFTDSCFLLKICRRLTELWTEVRYMSPPPPRHLWALGFVAVSWHRDGNLCLSKMTQGKGFAAWFVTRGLVALCFWAGLFPLRVGYWCSVMAIRESLISKGSFQTSLLLLFCVGFTQNSLKLGLYYQQEEESRCHLQM